MPDPDLCCYDPDTGRVYTVKGRIVATYVIPTFGPTLAAAPAMRDLLRRFVVGILGDLSAELAEAEALLASLGPEVMP